MESQATDYNSTIPWLRVITHPHPDILVDEFLVGTPEPGKDDELYSFGTILNRRPNPLEKRLSKVYRTGVSLVRHFRNTGGGQRVIARYNPLCVMGPCRGSASITRLRLQGYPGPRHDLLMLIRVDFHLIRNLHLPARPSQSAVQQPLEAHIIQHRRADSDSDSDPQGEVAALCTQLTVSLVNLYSSRNALLSIITARSQKTLIRETRNSSQCRARKSRDPSHFPAEDCWKVRV